MTFCLLFCTPTPFLKAVYLIRKEFALSGSKFFPYRVNTFSEGDKNDSHTSFAESTVYMSLK